MFVRNRAKALVLSATGTMGRAARCARRVARLGARLPPPPARGSRLGGSRLEGGRAGGRAARGRAARGRAARGSRVTHAWRFWRAHGARTVAGNLEEGEWDRVARGGPAPIAGAGWTIPGQKKAPHSGACWGGARRVRRQRVAAIRARDQEWRCRASGARLRHCTRGTARTSQPC